MFIFSFILYEVEELGKLFTILPKIHIHTVAYTAKRNLGWKSGGLFFLLVLET